MSVIIDIEGSIPFGTEEPKEIVHLKFMTCHKCGRPADYKCRGCDDPICSWCDLTETQTCNAACREEARRKRQHDLFHERE